MLQETKEFKRLNKLFEDLLYRHDAISVFDDLLTVTICALAMGTMENEYQEVIVRYNKSEQTMLANMFAELLLTFDAGSDANGRWSDPLGNLFEEHNGKFGRDARGQFFTPETVCNFMAQITEPVPGSYVTDPACGSGRTLIAGDRINSENRIHNFYVGCDLDHRCVKMCAINMAMYGMKGVAIHMDSLRMEIFGGYRIYLAETGLGIRKMSKGGCLYHLTTPDKPEKKEEPQVEIVPEPIVTPTSQNVTQLSLF